MRAAALMRRTSGNIANDVARLLQVLSPEASYPLPSTVANDMRSFIETTAAEADYDPRQFKVNMTREEVADRLRAASRP